MEELRSTEILDKEIEADARKKTEKILSRAEDECKSILDDVVRRVNEAKSQKESYYAEKLQQFEKSIDEALEMNRLFSPPCKIWKNDEAFGRDYSDYWDKGDDFSGALFMFDVACKEK